jgi:hypothetical protein
VPLDSLTSLEKCFYYLNCNFFFSGSDLDKRVGNTDLEP